MIRPAAQPYDSPIASVPTLAGTRPGNRRSKGALAIGVASVLLAGLGLTAYGLLNRSPEPAPPAPAPSSTATATPTASGSPAATATNPTSSNSTPTQATGPVAETPSIAEAPDTPVPPQSPTVIGTPVTGRYQGKMDGERCAPYRLGLNLVEDSQGQVRGTITIACDNGRRGTESVSGWRDGRQVNLSTTAWVENPGKFKADEYELIFDANSQAFMGKSWCPTCADSREWATSGSRVE